MASGGKVEVETLNKALIAARISEGKEANNGGENAGGCQINCFTEVVNDVTLHFQIIRLPRQIYVWIGYNSAKFGNLYAAAPTPPINEVSVSCVLGGAYDNTGSGIARRLVLKTGLHAVLASNIPKNLPLIEAEAEKMLVQKLIQLGYTKPRLEASSSQLLHLHGFHELCYQLLKGVDCSKASFSLLLFLNSMEETKKKDATP